MKTTNTMIKPRYAETDQMGVIHHANYLIYLELGRIDWLEQLGFSYPVMEANGVLLPVRNININYNRPLTLNNLITVETSLQKLPSTRVIFDYKIWNEKGENCCDAELTLVFTDKATFRPRKPLPDFMESCQKLFLD